MVPAQVTECRISLVAVGGSIQQSYSLLPEFKQIFESFPRPTDARHDDIREQAYCSYNSGCVNCLWHRFYRNIELTQRKSGIVVGVIVFVKVAVKAFWVSILSAIAVLTINYLIPQVYFPDNNVGLLPML